MAKLSETFFMLCEEKLKFLITDYECSITQKDSKWYRDAIVFQNKTTAVELELSREFAGLYVWLIRLRNGQVPEVPIFISENTSLDKHNLDDLVSIKCPVRAVQHKQWHEFFANEKQNMVADLEEYTILIKELARSCLLGDFSDWPNLDRIVAKRVREIRRKEG